MMEPRIETELGELPASWRVVPLGELLSEAQYGASVKGAASGGCPILRMTNQVNGRISPSNLQYADISARELETFRVQRGDILFNRTNSFELVGRTAIFDLDGDYVFASYLIRLRTLAAILDPFFLNVYLNADGTQRRLKSIATRAVSQSNISATRLRGFVVPVPPLAEQRKIAEVLGLVQRALEQQERLIALTTELKKTLLHQLFTQGLRGEPQKQTEIGPVPEGWEVVELITAVEQIDYGISVPIPKTLPENGIKIVSTADITKDGRLLYGKIRRIEAPEKTVKRLTLYTGDVLFNWRNSAELIGKSAVFQEQDEPHVFASFILRIRCGEKKSHNFYLAHLMNHFREKEVFIKLARRAVNQANYNRNEISVLKIPLPPYQEQRDIADVIAVTDAKIDLQRGKHAALTALFRTLLHQLMTAQIRVHDVDFLDLGVDCETRDKPEACQLLAGG